MDIWWYCGVGEWIYGGTVCVVEWTYGGTVCVGEWTYGGNVVLVNGYMEVMCVLKMDVWR